MSSNTNINTTMTGFAEKLLVVQKEIQVREVQKEGMNWKF